MRLTIFLILMLFFNISYSQVKSDFTKCLETDNINKLIKKYNIRKKNDLELYKLSVRKLSYLNYLTKELEKSLDSTNQIKIYNDNIYKLKKLSTSDSFKKFTSNFKNEIDRNYSVIKNNLDSINLIKKEYDSINFLLYVNQCQINSELKLIQDTLKKVSGSFIFKYFNDRIFCAYIVDSNDVVNFHYKSSKDERLINLEKVKSNLEKDNLNVKMITNGGMYSPLNEPQGLYIENFREIKELDTLNPNDGTNFYLLPNGVFYLDSVNNYYVNKTINFKNERKSLKSIKYATQSGPMLVFDGKIHPSFVKTSKNEKIRSGVGITKENKLVFLISMDECNFFDFASCFLEVFNCKNAMFLDGAISKMYLNSIPTDYKNGNFVPMISITNKYKSKK